MPHAPSTVSAYAGEAIATLNVPVPTLSDEPVHKEASDRLISNILIVPAYLRAVGPLIINKLL